MLKFDEQKQIDSVNGALALRKKIEEIVDGFCRDGYKNICWLGIGGTYASCLQAQVHMKERSELDFFVENAAEYMTTGNKRIGEGTVVRSLDSPQGGYTAQVVSDDQGAMGGNTRVQTVRPARTVNLLFLTLEDAPQEIWTGEYSVSASLPLEWQDENTLLIDGEAYSVSQKG